MFVTNWLTWNTEMMQANCSNSQQYHVWLGLYLFVFQHSASTVIALWAAARQTKLRKKQKKKKTASEVQSALTSRLFRSQQACGAQHPAVPCTVIHLSCHIESSAPRLRSLVQRKGFQPLLLCGSVMCPCQLAGAAWKVATLWHLHCTHQALLTPQDIKGDNVTWCASTLKNSEVSEPVDHVSGSVSAMVNWESTESTAELWK